MTRHVESSDTEPSREKASTQKMVEHYKPTLHMAPMVLVVHVSRPQQLILMKHPYQLAQIRESRSWVLVAVDAEWELSKVSGKEPARRRLRSHQSRAEKQRAVADDNLDLKFEAQTTPCCFQPWFTGAMRAGSFLETVNTAVLTVFPLTFTSPSGSTS